MSKKEHTDTEGKVIRCNMSSLPVKTLDTQVRCTDSKNAPKYMTFVPAVWCLEFFNCQSHSQTQQWYVIPIIPRPLSLMSSPVCAPNCRIHTQSDTGAMNRALMLLVWRKPYYAAPTKILGTITLLCRTYSTQGVFSNLGLKEPSCCDSCALCMLIEYHFRIFF